MKAKNITMRKCTENLILLDYSVDPTFSPEHIAEQRQRKSSTATSILLSTGGDHNRHNMCHT